MSAPLFRIAALTIAGSDSGGGAGMQADLKTFSGLGVFGASAVTCMTVQSPSGVSAIKVLDASTVTEQIRKDCEAYPIAAAKTGMLCSAEIIRAVAEADVKMGIPVLVVDPMMVAASGERLLRPDAVDVLCAESLPTARVVTPDLIESEIILGRSIATENDLRAAAREIGEKFDVACVIKGGRLGGVHGIDALFDEGEEMVFKSPRIEARETYGLRCAFSAALTAYLARGHLLADAVRKANDCAIGAWEHASALGKHQPLNFFWNVSLRGPF